MTSAESAPRISVIIPVYRDWDDLRRCLAALTQQSWSESDFEILVVNNDTQPAPDDLVAPNLRLLQEPQGHSYAARNAGVAAARGELLAFTDADCQPAPDWLAAGWAALHAGSAGTLPSGRGNYSRSTDRVNGLVGRAAARQLVDHWPCDRLVGLPAYPDGNERPD